MSNNATISVRAVCTWRFVTFSTLVLLLYSAGAKAECIKPTWNDPASLIPLAREARFDLVFEFQARVHEFVVCQRSSLEKRARGLAPSDVRQLILRDRAGEERALTELDQLDRCASLARREPDPGTVRTKCEEFIEWALKERRPPEKPWYTELKSEQRSAHGGVWIYRTLDFGRPGQCNHVECDNMLGVEVTNLTPVVLRCEVALTISNRQDGTNRGEQVITLYPGDSFPAARVASYLSPEGIETEVTCSAARPLAPDLSVPASCVLNWLPRPMEFPKGFSRSSWVSGTALVEFSVRQNYQPPEAIHIVQEDPGIGRAALGVVEKLRPSTNCAGQRFRVRVEYRAFPCYGCWFESGVVTLSRDDRLLP